MVPKTSASSDSPWMGLAKYAWSGYVAVTPRVLEIAQSSCFNQNFCLHRYVIECPNCGVIYRSRQYWYGNQDPVDTVVRTEIKHVWPGVRNPQLNHLSVATGDSLLCPLQSDGFLKDNSNAAQRLLDGVNLVAQSVSELSVKPAKAVTSWLTDQIAPAYWKPNSLISVSDTRGPARPPPASNSQVDTSLTSDMFYWLARHSSYAILRSQVTR